MQSVSVNIIQYHQTEILAIHWLSDILGLHRVWISCQQSVSQKISWNRFDLNRNTFRRKHEDASTNLPMSSNVLFCKNNWEFKIGQAKNHTAQSPFEILEAGLPGSSLEPRGKEAQPPPGAPGLGGPARDCWGFAKYLGGLRPVWPALSTKTRAHCTDCICAQKAQLETNNGH